jgi:hydrogenase expression/formation protein HypE
MNSAQERMTLAHGEGARATRELITSRILTRFDNQHLNQLADAAELRVATDRIAMTTDSFVVSPLIFPGGDIGSMAVYGTVNDLAVSGAIPRWLSLALIIEEGLPFSVFDTILDSIAAAAKRCHVMIVTGDTKVVPAGTADGLFINTTGIGELDAAVIGGPRTIREGDSLIVSGPIGRHGIAVLSAREELALDPPPVSDCAPLFDAVSCLRQNVGESVRAIRDATRGGISAVLHEWASDCHLTMQVDEAKIPITDDVRGASELLGLDPLYIANEGTMMIAVDSAAEANALAALRSVPETQNAAVIGRVTQRKISAVTIQRMLGGEQPVDEPSGALLPRIC